MSKNNSNQVASETFMYSNKIHWSYSFGSFFDDFGTTVLGTWYFIFYETEIGLNTILISIALIIYGIWNAINDPIAGVISDYPFKFTRKKGKRFKRKCGNRNRISIPITVYKLDPSKNESTGSPVESSLGVSYQ